MPGILKRQRLAAMKKSARKREKKRAEIQKRIREKKKKK